MVVKFVNDAANIYRIIKDLLRTAALLFVAYEFFRMGASVNQIVLLIDKIC